MEYNNKKNNNRRKSSVDLGTMVFGKIPPQAKELEEAVLGAIMLERDAFERANELIKPESFYVESHQRIYQAMTALYERRDPIDMMTVVEQLKTNEDLELVGGPYYVTKLTNSVVSAANIEAHCRIIVQKYMSREMIRIGGQMIADSYEDGKDVFDVLDISEDDILNLRMNNIKKTFKPIQKVITENLAKIEELRFRDESITGVPTKFEDLDFVTSGWQPTDLIILAARPSVGKTAFALSVAKNAAESFYEEHIQKKMRQKAVGFFSLEMKDNQLVNRVLSNQSDVWLWRFRNGRMEDDHMKQIYSGADKLNKLQILIDDTAALSIQDFRSKAKSMVKKYNVGFIVVDYLQLMTDPTKNNREQEISSISRQLKMTAKELEIPIIALSQLSREYTKGQQSVAKAPQLSDLRESGAIEQDADVVMFLYKPTKEEIIDDPELETIFYAGIEKHRNGASPVKFIGKFVKETQSHRYLKVVDINTLKPLGDKWIPVPTAPASKNYYEVDKPDQMIIEKGSQMTRDAKNEDDDLPF